MMWGGGEGLLSGVVWFIKKKVCIEKKMIAEGSKKKKAKEEEYINSG